MDIRLDASVHGVALWTVTQSPIVRDGVKRVHELWGVGKDRNLRPCNGVTSKLDSPVSLVHTVWKISDTEQQTLNLC